MNEIIKRIIDESVEPEQKIEKILKVNHDKRQFFIRIPKKISDYFEIKKEDKIKFTVNIVYAKEEKRKIMVAEVIEG